MSRTSTIFLRLKWWFPAAVCFPAADGRSARSVPWETRGDTFHTHPPCRSCLPGARVHLRACPTAQARPARAMPLARVFLLLEVPEILRLAAQVWRQAGRAGIAPVSASYRPARLARMETAVSKEWSTLCCCCRPCPVRALRSLRTIALSCCYCCRCALLSPTAIPSRTNRFRDKFPTRHRR